MECHIPHGIVVIRYVVIQYDLASPSLPLRASLLNVVGIVAVVGPGLEVAVKPAMAILGKTTIASLSV